MHYKLLEDAENIQNKINSIIANACLNSDIKIDCCRCSAPCSDRYSGTLCRTRISLHLSRASGPAHGSASGK